MTLKSRGPVPLYSESLYMVYEPYTLLGLFWSVRLGVAGDPNLTK